MNLQQNAVIYFSIYYFNSRLDHILVH